MKSRNHCDLVTTTITTTSPTNTATTSPVTRRSTIRANCNNSRNNNNNRPITSTTFCKWPLHPTRQWQVWPPWPVPTAFSVNWPPRVWHKAATTTTTTTTTAFLGDFFFLKKKFFFCHPIPKKSWNERKSVTSTKYDTLIGPWRGSFSSQSESSISDPKWPTMARPLASTKPPAGGPGGWWWWCSTSRAKEENPKKSSAFLSWFLQVTSNNCHQRSFLFRSIRQLEQIRRINKKSPFPPSRGGNTNDHTHPQGTLFHPRGVTWLILSRPLKWRINRQMGSLCRAIYETKKKNKNKNGRAPNMSPVQCNKIPNYLAIKCGEKIVGNGQ